MRIQRTEQNRTKDACIVNQRHVSCDGGNLKLGHPKVYLEISKESVVCPYCSQVFVYKNRKHSSN